MMTFSLILALALGGQQQHLTITTGLTASECMQAVIDNPGAPLRCEKE